MWQMKTFTIAASLLAGLCLATAAQAGTRWGFNINIPIGGFIAAPACAPAPAFVYSAPAPEVVYAQPAPVVYAQPAPVAYAQPAPVVYAQPAPVVYAPAPVLYAPAPAVVYGAYAQPCYYGGPVVNFAFGYRGGYWGGYHGGGHR
jgi:hypothetical protein